MVLLKVGRRTQATRVPVVASLVNDSISCCNIVNPSLLVKIISAPLGRTD
ncbi:MAG: hypothetical protein R1F52_01150 [Candidatus Nitrosoabyssus spongiisocia]|nr:MAG: hypothetical protein R1F52_01150 [Nitrosopumilaceae archaeon AB1(1)]